MKEALGHATQQESLDQRPCPGPDNDQVGPKFPCEVRHFVRRLGAQLGSDAQRGCEPLLDQSIGLGLHLCRYPVLVGAYVLPGDPSTDDLLNDVDDLKGGSIQLSEMLGVLKRAIGVLRAVGRPNDLLEQENLSFDRACVELA